MEFKLAEFTKEQLDEGNALFKKSCPFVLSVANLEQLPITELPEVAFAGRSNVGKSSIINAITGQKGLAKTSNTPGRTQMLNYFCLDQKIHIVDLPGYGYAQAPEAMVKQWQKMITTYLQGRVNLKRVFLLIDSRHGIKKVDAEIMDMLDTAAVTYQVVLTKTDKIGYKALEQVIEETKKAIEKHPAAYVDILATSSEKYQGLDQLRYEIASLTK